MWGDPMECAACGRPLSFDEDRGYSCECSGSKKYRLRIYTNGEPVDLLLDGDTIISLTPGHIDPVDEKIDVDELYDRTQ